LEGYNPSPVQLLAMPRKSRDCVGTRVRPKQGAIERRRSMQTLALLVLIAVALILLTIALLNG
jgi:hypothetical protein